MTQETQIVILVESYCGLDALIERCGGAAVVEPLRTTTSSSWRNTDAFRLTMQTK